MRKINDYIAHGELHTFMHSGKMGMKWGFTDGAKNGNPTAGDFRKAEVAFDKKNNREKSAANKYAEMATKAKNDKLLEAEYAADQKKQDEDTAKANAVDAHNAEMTKDYDQFPIDPETMLSKNYDTGELTPYFNADNEYFDKDKPLKMTSEQRLRVDQGGIKGEIVTSKELGNVLCINGGMHTEPAKEVWMDTNGELYTGRYDEVAAVQKIKKIRSDAEAIENAKKSVASKTMEKVTDTVGDAAKSGASWVTNLFK